MRPERVPQLLLRLITELFVDVLDGVRTAAAISPVHACSYHWGDAVRCVERNSGEVNVVSVQLSEPRRGASSEYHHGVIAQALVV